MKPDASLVTKIDSLRLTTLDTEQLWGNSFYAAVEACVCEMYKHVNHSIYAPFPDAVLDQRSVAEYLEQTVIELPLPRRNGKSVRFTRVYEPDVTTLLEKWHFVTTNGRITPIVTYKRRKFGRGEMCIIRFQVNK